MSSGNKQSGGGCLGAFIALAIVIAIVLFLLSLVGHALGLTPTFSEVTDRPQGWLGRHYRGVVGGYVLTALLLAVVSAVVVLAIQTQDDDANRASIARDRLRAATIVGAAVIVVAIAAPVGARDNPRGNVPKLVGMSAAKADQKLTDAGLGAEFKEVATDDDHCRVTWQKPKPGGEVDQYGDVKLRCKVKVPDVVGRKADAAEARISDVGLTATLVNEPSDYDLTRCRVTSQGEKRFVPPNSSVRLRLKCKKPPPEPTPEPTPAPSTDTQSNCDPSYTPCVPPYPPDLDCADTGPVAVHGSDPHGLDADGDGRACGGD